mgnify:CR=1 FL=1
MGKGLEIMHKFSDEHISAVNRDRKVIFNFDALPAASSLKSINIDTLIQSNFEYFDDEHTRVDSVWWCWSEGNQANWPSRILPFMDHAPYKEWASKGIDPVQIFLDETKNRGMETFLTYRINGADNDIPVPNVAKIPMKEEHPDWLIHTHQGNMYVDLFGAGVTEDSNGKWNFAIQGVRDYKLSILKEIAEDYDFDGIELDFQGCPVLPPGHQWESRELLTEFMRSVRSMLQSVAAKRDRPFLLAARIPEYIVGCHFDGIDIETWVSEQLLDIIVMGIRSHDVDVESFRRMTSDKNIKLYASLDEAHTSDGYYAPPIEVLRGVLCNWFKRGVDGLHAFNFAFASDETLKKFGMLRQNRNAPVDLKLLREMNDIESMFLKDKAFVVQRRGGGHGPSVVPNPEDWNTPRWNYINTNMLAQLPVTLPEEENADSILTVNVYDDLMDETNPVKEITVHVLLSDSYDGDISTDDRLDRVNIATMGHKDGHLYNIPLPKGIESNIEVRVNNSLLDNVIVRDGWLVFKAKPEQFAIGQNLIGINSATNIETQILVEKLEVHVNYSGAPLNIHIYDTSHSSNA